MQKIILFLLVLFSFSFWACQSEMEFPEEFSDIYTLQSISFSLDPDSEGVTRETKMVGKAEVVNMGPETVPYTVSLLDTSLPESSLFRIAEDVPHRYIDFESLYTEVPIDIIENEIVFSFFRKAFRFNEEIASALTAGDILEATTWVPAYSSAVIESHAVYHHLTTSFTATFIGEITGEELQITGRWSGSFVADITYTLHTTSLISGNAAE